MNSRLIQRLPQTLCIAPSTTACLHDARGVILEVTRGCAWVTQEGNPDDVFVSAGEQLCIARDGLTIVSGHATAQSTVTFSLPAPGERGLWRSLRRLWRAEPLPPCAAASA